jgi:hypothetical protein
MGDPRSKIWSVAAEATSPDEVVGRDSGLAVLPYRSLKLRLPVAVVVPVVGREAYKNPEGDVDEEGDRLKDRVVEDEGVREESPKAA